MFALLACTPFTPTPATTTAPSRPPATPRATIVVAPATPRPSSTGGAAEQEFHVEVRTEAVFVENLAGECLALPDVTLRITFGWTECGG